MVLLIQNTTKAGHVVANLWAYCDNMDPDKDYEFTANGKTFYGVVPRPVIAEAYCYHKKDALAGTKDDSVKAYAVEIFNPTDVDVNLGEYTLDTIALSGTVSAGGYKVFYSYDAGDDADANDATLRRLPMSVAIMKKGSGFADDFAAALEQFGIA